MRDTRTEVPRRTRAAEVGQRRTWQRAAVLDALSDCADFVAARRSRSR